jgi:aspartate kinase
MPRTKRRFRCAVSPTGRASAAGIFGPLAEANINVDMIVQNISEDGKFTDMTFTVPSGDVDKALAVLERLKGDRLRRRAERSGHVEGVGHRHRHAEPRRRRRHRFQGAGRQGINIRAITTSEIKISILIDGPYTELAVRTLHSVYGLDKQ